MESFSRRPVGITGASGLIGQALCIALAEQEIPVIAWVRNPAEFAATLPGTLASRIQIHPYSLGQNLPPETPELLALIHAAVDITTFPLSKREERNHHGAEALLNSPISSERWIFISSLSAHPEAQSAYGRSKAQIEALFLAHPQGLIVRPGLVLGHSGLFAQIVRAIKRFPVAPLFWGGKQPIQVIPLANLVQGLVRLATQSLPLPLQREFNLASPQTLTIQEFYGIIGRALGRPIWMPKLPGDLILRALLLIERTFGIFGSGPPALGSEQMLGLQALRHWETEADLAALEMRIPDFEQWTQNQGSLPRTPETHSGT